MKNDSSAVTDSAVDSLLEVFISPFHQSPLVDRLPHLECELCAIVPVRNEAELLTQTLISLLEQVDLDGKPLAKNRYEIIILANNCTDESAQIARDFASQHPDLVLHVVERILPPPEAYIGRVRQMLMDEACFRLLSIGRLKGVIASTDGDTRVSPTWVAATLSEIERGADAVGGKILTEKTERASLEPYTRNCFLRGAGYYSLIVELEAYIDGDDFDCLPRHNHHYGASLAVTAEMYRKVGGMPAVRTPEDVAFYEALVKANARFRHSLAVKVTTAVRQSGRTEQGFANQLCIWTEMGRKHESFLVEPAAAVEHRLENRFRLRQIWKQYLKGYIPQDRDLVRIASALGINSNWLRSAIARHRTFGSLWFEVEDRQKLEGIWQNRWGLVPIQQAIADLRLRVSNLRQQRQAQVLVVARSPEVVWGKGA